MVAFSETPVNIRTVPHQSRQYSV